MQIHQVLPAALAFVFLCTACAQEERPRNPFDTDILVETFGYGPDTPSLVDYNDLYQGCPRRHQDGSVTATDGAGHTHSAIRLFWFAWYNFHPDTERI